MSEPLPEQGEPEGLEVQYAAGFNEETGEYEVGIGIEGLRVAINVHPSAFGLVEGFLAAIPEPVSELIEQAVEANEEAHSG